MQDYYSIYADIWLWHKRCLERLEDADFWDVCVQEAREIQGKYNSKFCNALVFNEMDEFKRLAREPCKG